VQTGTPVKVSYTPSTLSLQLPGAVPLDFVLIPAGQFTMGYDNPACPRRFPKQSPSHQVTIHRAFYLAKFPTSQGQWQAIMGNNPSPRANSNYAVNSVSYETIKKEFLPKIGKMFPELAFRLPSEAEWEYAYRAGTTTNFFFGDDELKAGAFAWTIDAYRMQEHPVGMKLPNPWGLHDLTGLVFQWCEDMAHDGYTGAPLDGSPWMAPGPDAREGERILRGYPPMAITGSLRYGSSADRWSRNKSEEDEYIGFRLVATHN
jgi:formylglycine-generating enzyme required for sulfatase activity